MPCFFPTTDLPVTASTGQYTVYVSRGLVGEAEALAAYLGKGKRAPRVLQVYRDVERSRVPAQAFADAFSDRVPGGDLVEHRIDGAVDWETIAASDADAVVAWLDGKDLPAEGFVLPDLYLSGILLDGSAKDLPDGQNVRRTHCFALPGREVPRIHRVHSWLRSRGVSSEAHERLQLDTFFALTVADHALVHLVTRFDRDFFVESAEHEAESGLNPGTYPRLSLGPGQRFASKGCYLVDSDFEPIGGWIVP